MLCRDQERVLPFPSALILKYRFLKCSAWWKGYLAADCDDLAFILISKGRAKSYNGDYLGFDSMLVICLLHHYIYLVLIMLRLGTIATKQFFAASLSAKDWGLPDDYEIFSSLGKGSSARVFMGINVLSRQKVVIKMFKQLPVDSIKQ